MRPIHPGIVPALLLTASAAFSEPPSIVHAPVACAVAEKFPRLTARFEPPDNVAAARLVFQGQTADWYSVAMKREGTGFEGVLPKPHKELKSFRYYIEVTDKTLGVSRTTEFTTSVVPSSSTCKGGAVSATVASASVVLQAPSGVAALPAGFASAGVVAGSAAGSTVAGAAGGQGVSSAAAAGVSAGGGLSGLAIAGIAAGVGGAAAIAVASGGGDDASPSPGSTLDGRWVGTFTDADATPNCGTLAFTTTLSLSVSGSNVSGSMTNLLTTVAPAGASGCAAPGTSFSGPVASGSANAGSVQFVANFTTVSPTRVFTFTGTWSGTALTGTYVTTIPTFPQFSSRGTLSATKQ